MDTLFFWLSKLVWFLISPLNFILLLLIVTWLLLRADSKRFARTLMGSIVLVLIFIAFFPVGEWLLHPLENQFKTNPQLPASVEGIVVLSGALNARDSALWGQTEVNGAAERELAFMRLAKMYTRARLVYTGGSSSLINQQYKAADVAKQLFQQQGMDTSRIIFERDSRNTYENASLSLALVKPELEGSWILVTSALHMPRAIGLFCKAGWPMIPYPVDHRTRPGHLLRIEYALGGHLSTLSDALHEWLGLLAYRLSGKTTALMPEQCRS